MKNLLKKLLLLFVTVFFDISCLNTTLCLRLYELREEKDYESIKDCIDINEWDNMSFKNVLKEIFKKYYNDNYQYYNDNYRSIEKTYNEESMEKHYKDVYEVIYGDGGIISKINRGLENKLTIDDFMDFIDSISSMAREGRWVPHIALCRVVVVDASNNIYSYPIPYLFFSGSIPNGLTKILIALRQDFKNLKKLKQNTKNEEIDQMATNIFTNSRKNGTSSNITNYNILECSQKLHIANSIIGGSDKNLNSLIQTVESSGITRGDGIDNMNFLHSERAIGLALSNINNVTLNLINKIINLHNTKYQNKAKCFIIQIKTSLPTCYDCQNFWMGNARIKDNKFFRDANKFFRDAGEYFKLNNPTGENWFLRISNRAPIIGF